MFGWLSKERNYEFACPMCNASQTLRINPEKFDLAGEAYRDQGKLLGVSPCQFCKLEMTVVLVGGGKIRAYDEKWEKVEAQHHEKLEALEDQIIEVEKTLKSKPGNKSLTDKLTKLNARMEKMEDTYGEKEDRHADRQGRWQEKWDDKNNG